MFELHIGDDYLTITTPSEAVWTLRYPVDEDIQEAQAMIDVLNEAANKPIDS